MSPKFVRWLKHSGYIRDYVSLPDSELPFAEGKFDPEKEIVYYRESVWQAAESGKPRASWTLIHEGCHAICKHKEVRHRANAALNLSRFSPRARREETETDRLAACIL